MRKLLLFALLLSSIITSAQTSTSNGNCKAAFKYQVNDKLMSPIAGTAINFYDLSSGNITYWFWDFGDGTTSTEQNPMHRFTLPVAGPNVKFSPYRTVSLTILTSDSCKSLYSQVINIIEGSTTPPISCMAGFKYYQTAFDSLRGTVTFHLVNLSIGDSLQYEWNFMDGKTSTEKEPTVNFDLSQKVRKVCLTVRGTNNCSNEFCDAITITNPVIPIDPNPVQCETSFGYKVNYDIKTFAPALVLDFYSKAYPEATKWTWNFGDGTTSAEANPTHFFNLPLANDTMVGTHIPIINVCLTVETVTGCTASHCETINIVQDTIPVDPNPIKCETSFGYKVNYDIKTFAPASVLDFYSKAYPEATKWTWNFGDGTTSEEANPTHIFNLPLANDTIVGTHIPFINVCLTTETMTGCIASHCEIININKDTIPIDPNPVKCETSFGYKVNYDIKTFAPALVLDFYSKVYPEATKWRWNFGDGTTSEEANPTHIFNYPLIKDSILSDPNPFRNVCLTVETATGCIATHCETINIYMNTTPPEPVPQCHAWIKYYPASDVITIPEVVAYKLIDASGSNVTRRLWTFEDGTTSSEAEPQITFNIFQPIHRVCLTIDTKDGCTSTWCETIYISGSVPPDSGYVTPPVKGYTMRYESTFPIQMSSCAGWAKAQVYMNDLPVKADNYMWSNGIAGQEVKGLCPTQIYTVKAIAPDGAYVSGTFQFNSDGTVTETPINWWVTGVKNYEFIQCDPGNKDFSIEWQLCNGSIVKGDSIPLTAINCGSNGSNMIVKDAAGMVIYTENISHNALITAIGSDKITPSVKLFPNPVKDVLNIQYSGRELAEMQLEIYDLAGRSISLQKFYNVESGQQLSVNVNSLKKGIYLCKLISDKQVIRIEKFTK